MSPFSNSEAAFLERRKQHFLVYTITDLRSCRRILSILKTNILIPDYSIYVKIIREYVALPDADDMTYPWKWDDNSNIIRCYKIDGYLVG